MDKIEDIKNIYQNYFKKSRNDCQVIKLLQMTLLNDYYTYYLINTFILYLLNTFILSSNSEVFLLSGSIYFYINSKFADKTVRG